MNILIGGLNNWACFGLKSDVLRLISTALILLMCYDIGYRCILPLSGRSVFESTETNQEESSPTHKCFTELETTDIPIHFLSGSFLYFSLKLIKGHFFILDLYSSKYTLLREIPPEASAF
ncbi:MAG: hypothetical protein IPM48_06260 [Saprospiraceae bacterium]|nr:hypothetical protein [Saprospiraceae bacterium]